MNRSTLYAAGGYLLCLSVIGWLWNENYSLREQAAHRDEASSGQEEDSFSRESRPQKSVQGRDKLSPPTQQQPDTRIGKGQKSKPGGGRNGESGSEKELVSVEGSRPEKDRGALDLTTDSKAAADPSDARTEIQVLASASEEAESLLKNGGFDQELAPWICKQGKIIHDPEDKGNGLLEITPEEGIFQLSQPFRLPAGKKEFTLSFRAKGSESLTGLSLQLLDAEGKSPSLATSLQPYEKTGEWGNFTMRFNREQLEPSDLKAFSGTFAIKVTHLKVSPLWIDNVSLK